MLWKTRGTVRREAQGEKQVKRYLEFTLPDNSDDEIEGTLHKNEICEEMNTTPGTFTFVRTVINFADRFDDRELRVGHKIGRGAWVYVKATHQCPVCFGETNE